MENDIIYLWLKGIFYLNRYDKTNPRFFHLQLFDLFDNFVGNNPYLLCGSVTQYKDWGLLNSRIWLVETDIDCSLDFLI